MANRLAVRLFLCNFALDYGLSAGNLPMTIVVAPSKTAGRGP